MIEFIGFDMIHLFLKSYSSIIFIIDDNIFKLYKTKIKKIISILERNNINILYYIINNITRRM